MSIYQIVIKGQASGLAQLRNVHHYEFPSYVPTAEELAEAVQGIADAYEEILRGMHPGTVVFNSVDARRVDIGDQPTSEIVPDGWPFAGSAAGAQQPPQVAAMASWKAQTDYPRSCRTYLFPAAVTVGDTNGRIASVWVTAIGTFQLALEEVPVAGQVDAQKVAVQYGGDPRVVTASNLVSSTTVTNVFATQRSRRYGVGI